MRGRLREIDTQLELWGTAFAVLLVVTMVGCGRFGLTPHDLDAASRGDASGDGAVEDAGREADTQDADGTRPDVADSDPDQIGEDASDPDGAGDADADIDDSGPLTGTMIWGDTVGAASSSVSPANSTVDAWGTIYVIGRFGGVLELAGSTLTNTGRQDIFIAAVDDGGTWKWAHQFEEVTNPGGILVDGRPGIAVDSSSNVFATAEFSGSVDFGDGLRTSAGTDDIFVVSLDSAGAFRWAHHFGGSLAELTSGIVTNDSDEVVVVSSFPGSFVIGGDLVAAVGGRDLLIASYDSEGGYLWSRQFGGPNEDFCKRAAIDGVGNFYLTGYFNTSTDLGLGTVTSAGSADAFVSRYDPVGDPSLGNRIGGSSFDMGSDVAVDSEGNFVVTGFFEGTVDFGAEPTASHGGRDIFIACFNGAGELSWVNTYGSDSTDEGEAIAMDADGNVYVTGNFQGDVDFGDGLRSSAGSSDVFVLSLDRNGELLWVITFGGAGSDKGVNIEMHPDRGAVVTGEFNESFELDGTSFDSGSSLAMFVISLG